MFRKPLRDLNYLSLKMSTTGVSDFSLFTAHFGGVSFFKIWHAKYFVFGAVEQFSSLSFHCVCVRVWPTMEPETIIEMAPITSLVTTSQNSEEQGLLTTSADTAARGSSRAIIKSSSRSAFFSNFFCFSVIGCFGKKTKLVISREVLEANSFTFAYTSKKVSPIGYESPGSLFHSILSWHIIGQSCPICKKSYCEGDNLR